MAKDLPAETTARMAVPLWKLTSRSRRVEGRLWVDLRRSRVAEWRPAVFGQKLPVTYVAGKSLRRLLRFVTGHLNVNAST